MNKATFAGGCFWCTEAIFRRLKGVTKVVSGYTGGIVANPNYEQVSSGRTGHAEAIEIIYDEDQIPYTILVEIFMATHDPTTLNQQGADHGTQYRSAIFYHDEKQKKIAELAVRQFKGSVTQVVSASDFYPAEIEHQQYYELNNNAPYCSLIIAPKIHKLLEQYGEQVMSGYK